MAETLFAAAYMKLERAKQFMNEFDLSCKAYEASQPLTIKVTPTGGDFTIEGHTKPFGLMPGAMVGDAVHNIRAALDLMASELAEINDESPEKVAFPFSIDEASLEKEIKRKSFNKCGDDAVGLLLGLAPYRGGNDKLRYLHEMDIEDKHTALIPSDSKARLRLNLQLVPYGEFFACETPVHIIFPKGHAFEHLPVLETLEELFQIVVDILKKFERMVKLRSFT